MSVKALTVVFRLFQELCTTSSEFPRRRPIPTTPCRELKSSVPLCLQTSPIHLTTTALVSFCQLVSLAVILCYLTLFTLFLLLAMSENYVVFIEQPIKLDLLKIATCKLRGQALSKGVYWDPKQETVFHLISKHTGEVRGSLG